MPQLGEVVEAVDAAAATLSPRLEDPDVVRAVYLPLRHSLPQLCQHVQNLQHHADRGQQSHRTL